MNAVNKNSLNLRDVPEKVINNELVKAAITNTQLSLLVAPLDFVENKDFNELLDSLRLKIYKKTFLIFQYKIGLLLMDIIQTVSVMI